VTLLVSKSLVIWATSKYCACSFATPWLATWGNAGAAWGPKFALISSNKVSDAPIFWQFQNYHCLPTYIRPYWCSSLIPIAWIAYFLNRWFRHSKKSTVTQKDSAPGKNKLSNFWWLGNIPK
jgi:hypothetical protein